MPPDDDSRFDANGGRRESSPPPPVAAEGSAGRLPVDRELDRLREMSRNAEETVSLFVLSRSGADEITEGRETDQRDVRGHYRQYDGSPAAFERCALLPPPPVCHRRLTMLITVRVAIG